MAAPLKEMYHEAFLRAFPGRVRSRMADFDEERFVGLTLAPGWDGLEDIAEECRPRAVLLP